MFRFLTVALSLFHACVQAKDYEFIVVGAGSAGSIVASRLANQGASVLVIEQGGDSTDPAINDMTQYFQVAFNPYNYGFLNYAYNTVPQNIGGAQRQFFLPRGKGLGGSFQINAAAFVTGHMGDFNKIAGVVGDNDWSWNSIKTYMTQLATDLGIVKYGIEQTGGAEYAESAERVIGIGYNPNCENGTENGFCPSLWTGSQGPTGGVRHNSFNTYLRPLWATGKVDVVTFHRVNKLLFNGTDSTQVTGVETYNLRSLMTSQWRATKEVILCGGTYNSPQMLLLSGIGPQDELQALGIPVKVALPGVGKNLRDHYSVPTYWTLGSLKVDQPFLFQSPVMSMFGPEKSGQPTYQFEISGGYGTVVPLRASSVGEVTLSSSNPDDKVLINPMAASNANDIQLLVDGLKNFILPFFGDLIRKGLLLQGSISPNATDADIRSYIQYMVGPSHHPVGTCKTGNATDPMAVVDNEFRVRGVGNLRIIDASVFPWVPSGNINAPTMAAAHLGATKVINSYSSLAAYGKGNGNGNAYGGSKNGNNGSGNGNRNLRARYA